MRPSSLIWAFVGLSVLEGLVHPPAGIWQKLRCLQCGVEPSKDYVENHNQLPDLSQGDSRLVLGGLLWSQESPGWKPDLYGCKNNCLPVSFSSSCFSVVVLHYKYLVTSFVLHCLTVRELVWEGESEHCLSILSFPLQKYALLSATLKSSLSRICQGWQNRIDHSQTDIFITFAIYQTLAFPPGWPQHATEMEAYHPPHRGVAKVTPR